MQIAAVVAARPGGGFPCWPPRVCGGVGGPSLSALVCSRLAGAVPPAGADGAGRLAVGGGVQIGGGSVIFGSSTVGPSVGSAVLAHALLGRRGTPSAHASGRATLHDKMALLLALAEWKYIRKNLVTSRDGRI